MHSKVLSQDAWQTIRALAGGGRLDSWTLAGGTGLALHLGHRYSEDLDLFGTESFDSARLAEELSGPGRVRIQSRSEATLHVELDGLRISFLKAEAPLLFEGTAYRGLTVADPRDIGVMKLVAVGGRGSRKDFVDLFFLLKAGGTLPGLFELLHRRFQNVDHNTYHLLKSLVHFEDAQEEPMPTMIRPVEWTTVKETLVQAVRRMS